MAINNVTGNTLLESGAFPPCRAATTVAIALSGLQTIDGVVLNAGDRVLVWQQADQTTNGIYSVSTGNWVRTTDAQSNTQFFDGMVVFVAAGSLYNGSMFQCTCTDDPVVIGTSDLTFNRINDPVNISIIPVPPLVGGSTLSLVINGSLQVTGGALALAPLSPIASRWVSSFSTAGVPQLTQPAFTDISGTLAVTGGGTGSAAPSGTALDNITGFSATGFLTRTGAGSYAFQSTTNGITNGNLVQTPAWTLKGNPSGATANVTDFTIPSLTLKSSPVAGDLVMIADSAASFGFKYSLVSSISSVGSSIPANQDNFLPNVNWQLWSALTYIGKENSAGNGSYPAIEFTDPGAQTTTPTLTVVTGTTAPITVGDIVILSRVSGGAFNYWGYAGTAYANATPVGARVITVASTQIVLQAPLNAVSPVAGATWNVQGIGIGDRAGSLQGPDGWIKTSTLNIWADDFAANVCPGAIRVLGMTKGITGAEDIFWQCAPNQLRRFQGQTITFGVLVWQKIQGGSGTWRAFIHDNVTGAVFSASGTGSGTGYQFLSVTATVSQSCTSLLIGLETDGNAGDTYYMALPTGVIGSTLTAGGCKQNQFDLISATAHWNPPILLGYQFNFPLTDTPTGSGLYTINGIDMEAISLCQCHNSFRGVHCKVEFAVATVSSPNQIIFSGNNVNVGGSGPTTQSLKFGPQTAAQGNGLTNVGQGVLPPWYDGTFALFTNKSGGAVFQEDTWDFWDVIGSASLSLN